MHCHCNGLFTTGTQKYATKMKTAIIYTYRRVSAGSECSLSLFLRRLIRSATVIAAARLRASCRSCDGHHIIMRQLPYLNTNREEIHTNGMEMITILYRHTHGTHTYECVCIAYIMGGKVLFMAAATAVDTIPHCDFALISAVAFYLRACNLSMLPAIRWGFSFMSQAVCTWPMSQSQSQHFALPVCHSPIALLHCRKLKQVSNVAKVETSSASVPCRTQQWHYLQWI